MNTINQQNEYMADCIADLRHRFLDQLNPIVASAIAEVNRERAEASLKRAELSCGAYQVPCCGCYRRCPMLSEAPEK